ncbi:MAG: hypothetical protein ACP5UA_04880 [Candidatus Hydrogenedens sp.]
MKSKKYYPYILLIVVIIHIPSYPEIPKTDTQFLIGNGNMLVGIKSDGNISFARWSGIGGSNHFGPLYRSVPQKEDKKPFIDSSTYMLQIQDSIYSLTEQGNLNITGKYVSPEIPLLEFEGTTKNNDITWKQEMFVHPSRDIICIHFRFNKNTQKDVTENFISYQNISPKSPPIIENAFLNDPKGFQKDFCVFWDMTLQTLIHFRPYNAGNSDVYKLEQIKETSNISKKFWQRFEEGVYIGICSTNPVKGANILNYPITPNDLSNTTKQNFPTTFHIFDDYCSSLIIQPSVTIDNTKEVTFFYIFTHNYSEMEESVQWLKTTNYNQMKETLFSCWKSRWEIAKKDIKENFAKNWLQITLCTDPTTGAILTNPFDPVWGNRISLHDCYFLIQSMNNMDMYDFSKKLISFWHQVGKKRKLSAKQTFPLWVYPDGTSACPEYWMDISQTAYFISIVYALSNNMNFTEKKDFLSEQWDVFTWSMDNLCLWKIPGDLLPAPSFTDSLNRDMQTANLLIQTLIGIQKGIQLAKMIYKPIPELWETRDKELQTYIRLLILNREPLEFLPNKDLSDWKKFFHEKNILWLLPVKYNGNIMILKDIK